RGPHAVSRPRGRRAFLSPARRIEDPPRPRQMAAAALARPAIAGGPTARPQARFHGAGRPLDRRPRRGDRPAGGGLGSGARPMRPRGGRARVRYGIAETRRPRRLDIAVLRALAPPPHRGPRIAAGYGRGALGL